MFTVVIALFSAVGAWLAWRRNPMYSAKSSVRMLGATALSIAALVFVIVGAVHLISNLSPAVAMGTMLAVVVVCAWAMIFIIQAVSTTKDAKLATALPPSATLVHFHRQKVYPWVKFLLIFIAACGVLGLVIPGDAKFIVLSFGGMAVFVGVVLVPVMYVNARKFDISLTALEYAPWVHWQYSLEQWRQWTDVQVSRSKVNPESLRKKLLKAARDVYCGHDGIFCDGVYLTWLSIDTYLVTATIDERPPRSLVFGFEKVVSTPYGGNPVTPIQQSVLIPTGAESDIARLQRELVARCPKARIALC